MIAVSDRSILATADMILHCSLLVSRNNPVTLVLGHMIIDADVEKILGEGLASVHYVPFSPLSFHILCYSPPRLCFLFLL